MFYDKNTFIINGDRQTNFFGFSYYFKKIWNKFHPKYLKNILDRK